MSKIEFVYFDLGNILVSFDPMIACENVGRLFGVSADAAKSAVYDSGLEDRYEHGEISEEDFLLSVIDRLGHAGRDVSLHGFLDALGDMFTPIASMRSAIQRVRDSGLPIGILSNTCFAHWDWVVRQGWPVMEGPFDVTVLSYEVGVMKPDAGIYEAAEKMAMQSAGVAPSGLLFLDDKPENVEAAIARGWNAAECLGGDDAISQLEKFGVIAKSAESNSQEA